MQESSTPASRTPAPRKSSGGASKERRRPADGRPLLEIQYHPSDIRRGVRYLFLTRRQVTLWASGVLAWILFVSFGLWAAPQVIESGVAKHRYDAELAIREEEGAKLQDHVAILRDLARESEDVRLQISKIYLTYGFTEQGESHGQGGYPAPPVLEVADSVYGETIADGQGLLGGIQEQVHVLEVFLEEIRSFEESNEDQVRTTPSISPIRSDEFVLTSPFGTRRSPFTQELDFHAGVDLAATLGTPIYAPADAVVSFAGRYSLRRNVSWWRYGNLITLRHGERLLTLYGHCEELSVKTGDKVHRGQQIGTVGNTGWSTNPHLHYEIRRLGDDDEWQPVDPRIYILDHRWRNEERMLIRARRAPDAQTYEPLPSTLRP